jgi:hypothetical protein
MGPQITHGFWHVGARGEQLLVVQGIPALSNKTVKTFKLKLASMLQFVLHAEEERRTKKHASSKEFGMNEKNGFMSPL